MYNFNNNILHNTVNSSQISNTNYPYRCQNINVTINQQSAKSKPAKNIESKLKILVWNANGLHGKIEELKLLISDQSPDVVAICEIKMNETSVNFLFDIRVFFPYYKIRNDKGGGVALLIRESLVSESIVLPSYLKNEEIVGVTIKYLET